MADAENQGSAEPGQAAAAAAAAAAEVMAAGDDDGAQGGPPPDAAATPMAVEPQGPAESVAKPRNDFIDSLPNSVRCRVLALKKLQKRCDKIEAKFDKEFQALERKYNEIYKPLLAKIQELTGEMEECAWTLQAEAEEEEDDDDFEEEEDEGEEEGAAAAAKGGDASAEMPDAAKN
uniref:Nucleosome assembly protein 1 like 5 n=1 Tax=Microcebus murinus TaxID=30608 RepID=A0A8C5VKE7_MICMU